MAHTAIGLAAGTGTIELVPAPGIGNRLKITEVYLDSVSSNDLYFRSGTAGTFHIGNVTQAVPISPTIPISTTKSFLCDENAPFVMNRSLSVAIAGIIIHETVKVSDVG